MEELPCEVVFPNTVSPAALALLQQFDAATIRNAQAIALAEVVEDAQRAIQAREKSLAAWARYCDALKNDLPAEELYAMAVRAGAAADFARATAETTRAGLAVLEEAVAALDGRPPA